MNVFYNLDGVGDVLLVQLTTEKTKEIRSESKGDVTLLYNETSNEPIGFNLFNASTYLKVETVGQVELTEDVVQSIQNALDQNNIDVKLNVDLTPKFVIGHILKLEKHPNADKLNVCTVNVGSETLQIVCGAANVAENQKVVVAKVGAVMPSGMVIRDAELRGVASSGMICSAKELALPDAPEEKGILVLDENALIGEPFVK